MLRCGGWRRLHAEEIARRRCRNVATRRAMRTVWGLEVDNPEYEHDDTTTPS
jgi:hypothetical protein